MSSTRRPTGERGSAYLLALTALLALTGLALSVSGVGQLERRLGAADLGRLQALNAADSGLAIAAARLLGGRPPAELTVDFGIEGGHGHVRASRSRVAAAEIAAVETCAACAPEEGWTKVRYRLSAIGERVLFADTSEGDERTTSRVRVEATLTLQPWPAPGEPGRSAEGAGDSPAPACSAEVQERVASALVDELHPPGCRPTGWRLRVRGVDPASGSICPVELPVCARMSDWRELRPRP